MRWTSMLAIYILFWSMSVFLVLPFGVRTSEEAGAHHVPGTAESSPHDFSMTRVVVRTTVVATILFGLFAANYQFGWLVPESFDFFGLSDAG